MSCLFISFLILEIFYFFIIINITRINFLMLPGRPFEFNCCSVSDYEKGGVLKVEDFERKAREGKCQWKSLKASP